MAVVTDILNRIPKYGLVSHWLGQEAVERLLRFGTANEHLFVDTVIACAKEERVDRTRRISKKLANIHAVEHELRDRLKKLLPLMFEKLGSRPFIPSKIETELVAHGDGAFFKRHIDTITHRDHEGRSRMISAVYYFHRLPKAFSGGALRIHSLAATGDQGTFVDIEPHYDTLVFFPSLFPHEVLPVNCGSSRFQDSRFAVNFWIHGV
jgi:Rps23 Pro-64 3,4-dihydroxylase Tpa1-like proline 4-hydroxylase